MITEADIENWFTYHPPTPEQQKQYVAIRDAAKAFAKVLVANTPAGPDQTYAVRLLRMAVMTGNQAIACNVVPEHNPKEVPPCPAR